MPNAFGRLLMAVWCSVLRLLLLRTNRRCVLKLRIMGTIGSEKQAVTGARICGLKQPVKCKAAIVILGWWCVNLCIQVLILMSLPV